MLFVKSLISERHARVVILILLLGKIIPTYSHCTKKKLVCVIIATPFSCQPFSYLECTKLNMRLSCNIQLMSNNKYIFPVS